MKCAGQEGANNFSDLWLDIWALLSYIGPEGEFKKNEVNRKMKILSNHIMRLLVVCVASLIVIMAMPLAVLAATTADVVITATPSYIALTNTPATWAVGVIAASSATGTTNGTYFTANNTGSVTSNITLLVTTANWTGGVGWIHSDTNTTGVDTVGLGYGVGSTDQYILKTTATNLTTNLAAASSVGWGMKLYAPTSFGDGAQKTVTVRLTIVQS